MDESKYVTFCATMLLFFYPSKVVDGVSLQNKLLIKVTSVVDLKID